MMPDGFRSYAMDRVSVMNDRAVWFMALTIIMTIQMVIADKALSETVRQQLSSIYMGMSPWELLIYILFGWTVLPIVTVSLHILYAWWETDGDPFTDDYWSEYA